MYISRGVEGQQYSCADCVHIERDIELSELYIMYVSRGSQAEDRRRPKRMVYAKLMLITALGSKIIVLELCIVCS
jgi:hypothetical protein